MDLLKEKTVLKLGISWKNGYPQKVDNKAINQLLDVLTVEQKEVLLIYI